MCLCIMLENTVKEMLVKKYLHDDMGCAEEL
mgnify:CR=1 FL=1